MSAKYTIKRLQGTGVEDQSLYLRAGMNWTLDEIRTMIDAAEHNTSLTSFSLRKMGRLNHLTVVPFIKLIENSSHLEEIALDTDEVDFSSFFSLSDRQRKQDKHRRMIADMLYHAMERNKSFSIKKLRTSAIEGNHQVFHQFLTTSRIESLTIKTNVLLSSEAAWALAASIRGLKTLKKIDFHFGCVTPALLSHIIVSLQNNPTIEKVDWNGNLSYEAFSGILTLCASCPKIKDVSITPTNPSVYDVAPLLHGMNFSETLESLKLCNVLIGDLDSIYSPQSNKTVQSLELDDVTFEDNSVAILQHFTGLKKLHFEDCDGVFSGIHKILSSLVELEKLKFLDKYEDEENGRLMRGMKQIVAKGPPKMTFNHEVTITKQMVSRVVAGLKARSKPIKELCLYYIEWEQGALNLFCSNALPLLTDIEGLTIGCYPNDIVDQQPEARNFILGLPALKKLKTLTFAFQIHDRETAKAVLSLLEKNEVIEHIEFLDFDGELESLEDQMYIFLYWNRCGRQLLRDPNVPLALWPYVLAKIADDEEYYDHDVMFEFVKSLNTQVHLFNNS